MKRAAALLVVSACHFRPWHDPVYFPTEQQHVPLDVEWQWPVHVYSGGSPAPMPVTDAQASCVPADACTVFFDVPPDPDFARPPRLSVIGTHAGTANVEITYMHPKREERMHATVEFVFEPAPQLHELAIGDAPPTGPFVYTYRGDRLHCDSWGSELDCYARDRDHFTCSGSGCGEPSSTEYQLELDVDAGRITAMTLTDIERRSVLQRTP
ncbi:MAG TPA: hypothetical protein VH143_29300 [Kofleriaceae bacterium]|nr:hypothetical protein [Kofleriaceae bacterium]